MNYNNISSATNCINPILKNLFQQVLQGISMMFYDTSIIYIICMIFCMLFVLCTCTAHNLVESRTNLEENWKKKFGFYRTRGTRFLQVWGGREGGEEGDEEVPGHQLLCDSTTCLNPAILVDQPQLRSLTPAAGTRDKGSQQGLSLR